MTWELRGIEDGSFLESLEEERPHWLQEMGKCPQDPIHHAEGDVLTHTRWVCQELATMERFQRLPDEDKQILAWAAVLHDVAKPKCVLHKGGGRIGAPGHAPKGAIMARRILWERGCPFAIREKICGLIYYHIACFWAIDQPEPERVVRKMSLRCSCRHLSILARADALGRECRDKQSLLDRVSLFAELAKESDCYNQTAEFASDVGRYLYFQERWHNPELEPYEDFKSRVILLSGLPASGKDTWLEQQAPGWPVISLDKIRLELGVSPLENQGPVINLARDRARVFLRKGDNFIWNATNISRQIRSKVTSLVLDYKAHLRIVYLEQPLTVLETRNSQREAAVPWSAIEKMIRKWEVPALTEAHVVDYLSNGLSC